MAVDPTNASKVHMTMGPCVSNGDGSIQPGQYLEPR